MSQALHAQLLSLTSRPVAITFVDAAPAGVSHVTATDRQVAVTGAGPLQARCSIPSQTITSAPQDATSGGGLRAA
jgi:hypothetical protein